ncbi:MAG TPA: capsule assembly Wzi family protein, partial [Anaeromyxobacteraceae bacterium]|nr:capsule assembly Wzi family protein [Anaeromyxobacteraceae bacterium]
MPLRLTSVFNTGYPSGGNDGLLWAGRGASTLVSAGVAFRYGVLSGVLRPEVTWSQNDWFETRSNGAAGELRFGSPYYGASIDLPQRFGAGPFSTAALGDSVLRLDWKGVALGVSNERMWWGPGLENALVLSDNAPGFPHAFLGTSRPVDVWIGKVEATAFWGRLDRTEYFADATDPLIVGLALDYAPRWIPGLTVGLGRTFLQPWDGREAMDYVPFLQSFWKKDLESWHGEGGDNPEDNQLASLWWRWVFPKAGLELYGEWGREDHDWSVYKFIEDFDHTQAYLLGLQKVFPLSARRFVRLHVEVVDLQEARPPDSERGMPTWYTHGNDL